MSSIILSFVGNQDPFSDNTSQEGSIVTLIRHLLTENHSIKRVILLHTLTTEERAELTKDWLRSEANLSSEIVEIIPVDEALSKDPVNLLLAAQEARKGLDKALPYLIKEDRLEFNASSGTPVMKSAWSILQAAGYAPKSCVWQIRNPKEMQPGQPRVFATNVDGLKKEFDFKVIKQQIEDYNYNGALTTLQGSNLYTAIIETLLHYGSYRMAFDFDRAFNSLQPWKDSLEPQWIAELSALRQKNKVALLREVYFKALIKLKTNQYADFLVDVFRFQEGFLRFVVQERLQKIDLPTTYPETRNFWEDVKQLEGGKLYQYLEKYRLKNGEKLTLSGFMNRIIMIAILEDSPKFSFLCSQIEALNEYCQQRNKCIHDFEGVSQIEVEDQETIKKNMREILQAVTNLPTKNPFNLLNEKIYALLTENLQV